MKNTRHVLHRCLLGASIVLLGAACGGKDDTSPGTLGTVTSGDSQHGGVDTDKTGSEDDDAGTVASGSSSSGGSPT